jgi:hypothetical protein
MARPLDGDGGASLEILRVAANILNYQSWKARQRVVLQLVGWARG